VFPLGPLTRLPSPILSFAGGPEQVVFGYPRPSAMPKMKTHSGAKKRFKLTAKGKVRGRHAFSSHILEKKTPKRKRGFRKPMEVSDHDAPRVKKLLGAKSR
jgi:large subunit ribosomal protein L35